MAPRFAFVPARWLSADAPLNASARLVLCVLCQWVNSRSGECWPSLPTIADHARLSLNTVRRAVRDLEKAGALIVQRGRTDAKGDSTSHLYTIVGYDPPQAAEKEATGPRKLSQASSAGKKVELMKTLGGPAIQIPPPLQPQTGGGVQDAPGVLQSRYPNGVKNVTTEVRSPSPPAAASSGDGELKPANWRGWKDRADDPQFMPGRRAAARPPLRDSAPALEAVDP